MQLKKLSPNPAMSEIEISFNGELRSVKSTNVLELLKEFELADRKLAVELNMKIVPRDSYESVTLSAGDTVEVVHFVGGG
jgi:thiamine biosynthesis protein ThiS